jgi:excisionase family DNA binding protein
MHFAFAVTPSAEFIMPSALPDEAPTLDRSRLLLTANETATRLHISPRTLWSLTKAGDVECVRIGRSVRYTPAALEAYIASRKGVHHAEA